MKSYKISRWDAILPSKSSNSLPMIYIEADKDLIVFAQKNNYKFPVIIRDTQSVYDGHKMMAVFDSLLLGPNCRSKTILDKNWYTLSLTSYFYGYPPENGTVDIIGMENSENHAAIKNNSTDDLSDILGSSNNLSEIKGMSVWQIVVFVIIIIIILVAILLIFHK